jgi:GWxTD domain-containing protein
MSPRHRGIAVLALAACVLAGAACRWYNLERKLDPANADFLTKVGYIITSGERRAFLLSPDAEKPKFIEEFWARRNPDPSSGENAFKAEYLKRIEQARRMFPGEGIPGWMTDRGRILVLFGPPTDRDIRSFGDAANRCQEVWYYGDFPVIFIDASCTGTFRLATMDFSSLREINLMYMHDLNFALDEMAKPAARPPEAAAKTLEFDADLAIRLRTPDRIEAVLGVEIAYERIWFKAEGTMMTTTIEAALELRDAKQALVWESRVQHEIRLRDTEVSRMTGTKYRWEIPIVVEGAERVGRLGRGRDALAITLTNATGKESSKKALDFK